MLDELSLFKKVIFSVENGEVTTIVGPNVSSLRRWLDNETVPNRERPILLLERITKIPCLDSLLDNYIHTLAEAALRLWPVWYTDIDLSRFDASASGIRGIHAAFESIGAQNCKISAVWARKAIVPVLCAHPPMLTGFSNAEQVQQLTLAIHRHGVTMVLALEDHTATNEQLRVFAQSTRWLAERGGLAVIVLLPFRLAQDPALETILYGASFLPTTPNDLSPKTEPKFSKTYEDSAHSGNAIQIGASAEWLWPFIGRPHPFSPAEQKLAVALAADQELASIFTFNQVVQTKAGTRYIVDLVWPQGRVAVEIDGYSFHSDEVAFARDRHRDYELTLSNYVVLRIPHGEVMEDVSNAVTKMRNLVKFRRDSGWPRGSSYAV